MISKNYDPNLCYFVVKFNRGVTDLFKCFGVRPQDFKTLEPYLENLESVVSPRLKRKTEQQQINAFLKENRALANDFMDPQTGLIWAGETFVSKPESGDASKDNSILKVGFYNERGLNDPYAFFPSKIDFKENAVVSFRENGNEIKNPDIIPHYIQSKSEMVLPGLEYKYQYMLQCVKSPKEFLDYPSELKEYHTAKILRIV